MTKLSHGTRQRKPHPTQPLTIMSAPCSPSSASIQRPRSLASIKRLALVCGREKNCGRVSRGRGCCANWNCEPAQQLLADQGSFSFPPSQPSSFSGLRRQKVGAAAFTALSSRWLRMEREPKGTAYSVSISCQPAELWMSIWKRDRSVSLWRLPLPQPRSGR